MTTTDPIDIQVNQLTDPAEHESVIFNLFNINSTIDKIISLLTKSSTTILATNLQTNAQHQLKYADIVYIDYVDRNVCLYAKDGGYWVKNSFIKVVKQLPENFIQISKNNAVNIYEVKVVDATLSGNLMIQLSTDEKLIVSRKYIKKFKEFLINAS